MEVYVIIKQTIDSDIGVESVWTSESKAKKEYVRLESVQGLLGENRTDFYYLESTTTSK